MQRMRSRAAPAPDGSSIVLAGNARASADGALATGRVFLRPRAGRGGALLFWILLLAIPVAGAWWLRPVGQPAGPRPASPFDESAGAQPLEYRGMAIQVNDTSLEKYLHLVNEVRGLGADTVLLSTAGYMEHARAQAIFIEARKTLAPADFGDLLKECRRIGLKPILMPIVLLKHPRGSEWRGVIDPPSWEEWWRQYRDFVKHFADIAREGSAEVFMVGSELVSTEKYTSEWLRVIDLARSLFPGKLGYSANWDHYKPVQFWDRLQLVGMTSYYTLADRENPTIDEIAARWNPVHRELMDWQRTIGKPIVLTEVGWCSQSGAAKAPWNYYQNQHASAEGLEEQRRLYEAFLRVWGDSPGLGGVIWWEWTDSPGGPDDYNYTPRNKPAEEVLRRWFGRPQATVSASP